MATNAPSTARVNRLCERRSRGVAMVAPVEVGEGGIGLTETSVARAALLFEDVI